MLQFQQHYYYYYYTFTRTINNKNNKIFVLLLLFVLLSSSTIVQVQCKLLRHQPIISCITNVDCYIPCISKPCPPIYHCMHGYCKNIKFYEICGTKRICNKGINEFCCNTASFNNINMTTYNYCSDGVCGSKHKNTIACPKISCSNTEELTTTTSSLLSTTTRIRIPTTTINIPTQSLP